MSAWFCKHTQPPQGQHTSSVFDDDDDDDSDDDDDDDDDVHVFDDDDNDDDSDDDDGHDGHDDGGGVDGGGGDENNLDDDVHASLLRKTRQDRIGQRQGVRKTKQGKTRFFLKQDKYKARKNQGIII